MSSAPQIDDRALLDAWKGGDHAAAEQLITRYYDAIVRFFVTKAGPDVEDLVQQTFLRLGEAAARYEGASSVRSFLYGIARNVLYEHIRRRVRDGRGAPDFRESALVDLSPGVVTMANARSDRRALVRALQTIPLEQQILLELYYWESASVAELAALFDVAPGTIKSRLSRARNQLRAAIPKVPPEFGDQASVTGMVADWLSVVRAELPDSSPGA